MKNSYQNNFKKFKSLLINNNYYFDELTTEFFFEKQKDWSELFTYRSLCKKIIKIKKKDRSNIKIKRLKNLKNWNYSKRGNLENINHDFFSIIGVELFTKNREIKKKSWEQPLIKEYFNKAGMLGLIRGRFNGVPHYLCQFKVEPGNYGKIHLAPTLQATFSNIYRHHGGKKPDFSNYFTNTKNKKILFKKEILEDGGRFYKKRNIAIMIETNNANKIKLPSQDFLWLSLFQIRKLMKDKIIINPHIKSILSLV
jgi:oxidase EvaA